MNTSDRPYTDFAKVDTRLYVGAHPEPEDPFELGADVVVTLTGEPSTTRGVPHDKLLIHWPIPDGPVPRPGVLRGVVRLICDCLDQGAAVFVHCRSGVNRSCLVAARVLMERGMTAEEAIERVRERRQGSLSDGYADWLRSEEANSPGDAVGRRAGAQDSRRGLDRAPPAGAELA